MNGGKYPKFEKIEYHDDLSKPPSNAVFIPSDVIIETSLTPVLTTGRNPSRLS